MALIALIVSAADSDMGVLGALGGALGTDALLLGCLLLATLACAALAGTIAERRKTRSLARTARTQTDSMRELIRTARLAESMAGIGVWQYVPETGTQEWSDGVKRLFGIDCTAKMEAGDAETLLYANGTDLIGMVNKQLDQIEPYTLQVNIKGFDNLPRTIALQACNMRSADGTVLRVIAIVRDATDTLIPLHAAEPSNGSLEAIAEGAKPQNARLPTEIEETPDAKVSLTGLFTRRAIMHQLDQLVVAAREKHSPLCLVMFDVDHLKRINDVHGRGEGDQVLQKVARIAREQARMIDPIGRMGGEEFLWIIPGANEGMVRVMSERMRLAIAKGSAVGAVGPVTISLGFAVMQASDTPLSLFARADRALFEAMHSGHNRVRAAA